MRYYFSTSRQTAMYGIKYACNHPLYSFCTLFKIGDRGIAVIQQRFDPDTKTTWWSDIDTELQDEIYLNINFKDYFDKVGAIQNEKGFYPTVTVRQIMWALKMKPLKKEPWETVFDRKSI